eukprot:11430096-Alexandrium_andersonii.AAC.1
MDSKRPLSQEGSDAGDEAKRRLVSMMAEAHGESPAGEAGKVPEQASAASSPAPAVGVKDEAVEGKEQDEEQEEKEDEDHEEADDDGEEEEEEEPKDATARKAPAK